VRHHPRRRLGELARLGPAARREHLIGIGERAQHHVVEVGGEDQHHRQSLQPGRGDHALLLRRGIEGQRAGERGLEADDHAGDVGGGEREPRHQPEEQPGGRLGADHQRERERLGGQRRQRRRQHRREREEIDEAARVRLDGIAQDLRRFRRRACEAHASEQDQDRHAEMAEQQHQREPGPGAQVGDDGSEIDRNEAGAKIEPDQIGKQDHDRDEACDPGTDGFQMRAPDLAGEHEQHDQAEQDHAAIGREQQQAAFDADREPVDEFAAMCRAPVVKQQHGPERRCEDRRPEFRRRHREHGDAGHQEHRHDGVDFADHGTAEVQHRPIRHNNADLREQINAGHAGEAIGEFREPESERWPALAAELEFMPDREHDGQVFRRRGVEQRRQQPP